MQELSYPDKSVSRFVADMSEKQISAREFFNAALLDELQRDFGLNKAIILIFDKIFMQERLKSAICRQCEGENLTNSQGALFYEGKRHR